MIWKGFFATVSLWLSLVLKPSSAALSGERRLMKDLLRGYNRVGTDARSEANGSHPTIVLVDVVAERWEVNSEQGTVSLDAIVIMRWDDSSLTWNSSAYGATNLAVSVDKIWSPDFVVYNVLKAPEYFFPNNHVQVLSNGSVTWTTKATYTLPLIQDSTEENDFNCSLQFASLTRTSDQVTLRPLLGPGVYVKSGWNVAYSVNSYDSQNTAQPEVMLDFGLAFSRKEALGDENDDVMSEKMLIMALRQRASTRGTDTRPSEEATAVTMTLNIVQVSSVDKEEETATLVIHSTLSWVDELLAWDTAPTNISSVAFDRNAIWTPDIVRIDETLPPEPIFSSESVQVRADGTVTQSRRDRYTVQLYPNVSAPHCYNTDMRFGSLTSTNVQLQLSEASSIDFLGSNNGAQIGRRQSVVDVADRGTESYSVVTFEFEIVTPERQPEPVGMLTNQEKWLANLKTFYGDGGPVTRPNTTAVAVDVSINILNVKKYDKDDDVIVFDARSLMSWYDSNILWNPEDFNNQSMFVVGGGHIWTPDIVVLDEISKPAAIQDIQYFVSDNGLVTSEVVLRHSANCKHQDGRSVCGFRYGSLSADSDKLSLGLSGNDSVITSEFDPDSPWSIIASHLTGNEVSLYKSSDQTYSVVELEFEATMKNSDNVGTEEVLIKSLMKNYFSTGPQPRVVDFLFSIYHILEFDQEKQFIEFAGQTIMSWTDANLVWDPEEYGGVTQISLKVDQVWTPDVALQNAIAEPGLIHEADVQIEYDGSASFMRETKEKIGCITNPEQTSPKCILLFASKSLDADHLQLSLGGRTRFDTSRLIAHSKWEVLRSPATIKEQTLNVKSTSLYSCVKNEMRLRKRRPLVDPNAEVDNAASSPSTSPILLFSFLFSLVSRRC